MSDIGMNPQPIGVNPQSVRYDDTTIADDTGVSERHSIQTYVSDMLALERHIAQPLERQRDMADTKRYAEAMTIIAQMKSLCDTHITALEQCLKLLGGHEASPVKSAWAGFLGWGAAAIDSIRKTKVSKNLRDDYTALNLAAISYEMLYTTAIGLGNNSSVADLAQRHLRDYAGCIFRIQDIIPGCVLQELQDDGERITTTAGEELRRTAHDIWNRTPA